MNIGGVKNEILFIAEKAAFDLGKQLVVNSARRTPEYNAYIGGATYSKHVTGEALDIRTWNMNRKEKILFLDSVKSMVR